MYLEERIERLTAAIEALTAALNKPVVPATTPLPEPTKPSVTPIEVKAQPEAKSEEPSQAYTHDAIRTLARPILDKGAAGREAVVAVLTSFGVKNITQLPVEKLAEVAAKLKEIEL